MTDAHVAVLSALEQKLNAARADLDHAIEHDGDPAKARRAVENLEKEIAKTQAAHADAAARVQAEREAAAVRAEQDLQAAANGDVAAVVAEVIQAVNAKLAAYGAGQIAADYSFFDHAARGVAVERRTDAARRSEAKVIADRLSGLERKLADREQQNQAIVDARIAGTVDPKDGATLLANEKDIERLHVLIANARDELNHANARVADQGAVVNARVADLNNSISGVVTSTLHARLARAEQELLAGARAVFADSQANGNRLSTFLSHYTWCPEIEKLFRLNRVI
ncbi:hypothetical protein J2785_007262 [Burkholderia ambifaria]|nr:hypothetical protein [Burkholderia ambifaria]MDR6504068.1 hypothetical protein [Burkholderia ambifaria]